jgi:hypothetical protein
MRPPQTYYSRKPRAVWGRHAKLELVLTIVVIVVGLAASVVFLLGYHVVPFGLSGGTSVLAG